MNNENRVVIGFKGEIGSAIMKYVDGTIGIDVDEQDGDWNDGDTFLHICIPYSQDFIGIVRGYIEDIKPVVTIIHTTCPVGTTRELGSANNDVVHVPIHGVHPHMLKDMRLYRFFVGAMDYEHGHMVCDYLDRYATLESRSYLCSSPESTEYHKIMSTELIRHIIMFYQEWKHHCLEMGIDWAEVIAALEMLRDKKIGAGGQPFNSRIFQRAGPLDTKISGKHCLSVNKDLVPWRKK